MTMRRDCDDDVDLDINMVGHVFKSVIRPEKNSYIFFHPALIRRGNFLQCYMINTLCLDS